jgi:hypothetical protein
LIGCWWRLPIWVELSTGVVCFPGIWLAKRTADPLRSSPTYCTSIDAVSMKLGGAFWGLIDISHPMGVIPENYSFSGTAVDNSSLNVYALISTHRPKIRIVTIDGSKRAFLQDIQGIFSKIREWGHFRGPNLHFSPKQLPNGISSENAVLNKF